MLSEDDIVDGESATTGGASKSITNQGTHSRANTSPLKDKFT